MLKLMQSIRNSLRLVSRFRASGLLALLAVTAVLLAASACNDDIQQARPQPQTAQQESQSSVERSQEAQEAAERSPQDQSGSQTTAESDDSQQAAQDGSQSQQAQAVQQAQQAQQTVEADPGPPTFIPRDAVETAEGIAIIRDRERPQRFGSGWATEWGIRIVDFNELSQGAGRDAIPALTAPRYVTLAEASTYYADDIPLVQINVDGDVRGYPLEILTWHEIVNDVVGGIPVAVTFCPLCNTAIAFESQIGAEVYQFGVSGLLRNSDLVMYDRNTESLWQQSSGRAIVGRMVGARLQYLPASVVSIGQLRSAHPDALILSRETGFTRSYGQNPYRGYDNPTDSGGPYGFFFDRDSIDPRLPPIERVVAIEGPSGAAIAYSWSLLQGEPVVHDNFDGIDLVVFWTPGARSALDASVISEAREVGATAVFETTFDGQALTFAPNPADPFGQTFTDEQTGSTWDIFGRAISGELEGAQLTRVIHSDHFWFAWQAFHPDTEIVDVPAAG